jgi:hypothetical protein
MRHSSIFRSRWMALLWAAGVLWFAYDVAGPPDSSDKSNNVATDVTGAPISDQDAKQVTDALNRL